MKRTCGPFFQERCDGHSQEGKGHSRPQTAQVIPKVERPVGWRVVEEGTDGSWPERFSSQFSLLRWTRLCNRLDFFSFLFKNFKFNHLVKKKSIMSWSLLLVYTHLQIKYSSCTEITPGDWLKPTKAKRPRLRFCFPPSHCSD